MMTEFQTESHAEQYWLEEQEDYDNCLQMKGVNDDFIYQCQQKVQM